MKIFEYSDNDNTWASINRIDNPQAGSNLGFGSSISMNADGSSIVIGCFSCNDSKGSTFRVMSLTKHIGR